MKNFKEKSDQGEEKLKEKDLEIEQLKELNKKKDKTLMNALKDDFEDLKGKNLKCSQTTDNQVFKKPKNKQAIILKR